jgi:hypothetical protein
LLWLERIERSTVGDFFNGRGIASLVQHCLLLTHYSNALFLLVQVLFAAAVLWHRSRPVSALAPVKAAVFYALQFAAALAVWRPVALSTGTRFQSDPKFVIAVLPTKSPASIFAEYIVMPNIVLPQIAYAALFLLLAAVLVKVAIRYFVRSGKRRRSRLFRTI